MSMVCGLDLHRGQITFDAVEVDTGEVWRGRGRTARFAAGCATSWRLGARRVGGLAVEGCTGWRYVVEEVRAAGFEAHLAEPADTQATRGRKRRAKTDRADAGAAGAAPGRGSARVVDPAQGGVGVAGRRLYKSLIDQRRVWVQRIHAECTSTAWRCPRRRSEPPETRALAGDGGAHPAAQERIAAGYRMIDATERARPLRTDRAVRAASRRAGPGRGPLRDRPAHGGGVWAELGDCRRFTRPCRWCATPAWT